MTAPRASVQVYTRLVEGLMSAHGLCPPAWRFAWGRGVRAIGRCTVRPDGTGVIRLSLPWAKAGGFCWDDIRQWALHEIAHALVGPHCGHGSAFAAKCLEIGCTLIGSTSPVFPAPPLPYEGECLSCASRFTSGQASRSPTRCPTCGKPSLLWSRVDARELRPIVS